ncbi:MAG: CoA transferase [Chloroflexi bacterium]|nr:CoA transferase [Chloroflexota bacterium]
MTGQTNADMLAPYRVLDLTDKKGFLCGRILGDLGADVIKVEPPEGDPTRNTAPFYHDIPDPEKSLYWFAYNANKRGITLDITTQDGKELFKKLVKTCHFVIESYPPGYMDSLGLGYQDLARTNPGIVMVSITPFGQDGPYQGFKSCDLVTQALGGFMYVCGDPDRAPVRVSFPQAFLFAGAEGAVGALMAHYSRETTGQGQYVDVSAQQSVVTSLLEAHMFWNYVQVILKREGPLRLRPTGLRWRQVWPCKDGHVAFLLMTGPSWAAHDQRLARLVDGEGMASASFKKIDWATWDFETASQEDYDRVIEPIYSFFQSHTKQEIYDMAVKHDLIVLPLSDPSDLVDDSQLKARGFWVEVYHPELEEAIKYPGAFFQASEASGRIRRRAPLIGEHNREIYEQELGISPEQMVVLKQAHVI